MPDETDSDRPVEELKHDAVPGYLKIFLAAFLVMGIYLACALVTSYGPTKGYHGDAKGSADSSSTDAHHDSH
ncbi:MAG: hypothetical protein AAF357_03685 [Verrucomicrobiota bacterium]